MIVILDPGHGKSTPGKRSPDNSLLEYKYCREIVNGIKEKLEGYNIKTLKTVNTDDDLSIKERVLYVNKICDKYGKNNVLLVSIHCNAAGNGSDWMSARGWSVFVSTNSSTNSKKLAECLFNSAKEKELKLRQPSQSQVYWVQNLGICRDTKCPAVLTENLFQDNKEDVAFLLSDSGKKTIIEVHVLGILEYLKEHSK